MGSIRNMVEIMTNQLSTVAALFAALGTLWFYGRYDAARIAAIPPSQWIEVRSVNVADFSVGKSEPPVIYDRTIHKPFDGKWEAEVHRVSDDFTLCFGNGEARYEPKDKLPPAGVTLDWFVGSHCVLPKGQYFIQVNYTITTDQNAVKHMQVASNIFNVTEPK